ncbi:MAG: carboxypeptidase regulatory-like domain-containing protein [Deltaproteobacteria bacterium]|nr:carboxypeptidase regulatory-like domain-containing protein [Deltaproteobacteria bacterium]
MDHADSIELVVFDMLTASTAATFEVPGPFDDVRAITWLPTCGNPSAGGPADMIVDATLDRTEVCPGEPACVSVSAVHPEGEPNEVFVSVNGQNGSQQCLQFFGEAGPRRILVRAGTIEHHVDSLALSVDVVDCGADRVFPRIYVRPNRFHPRTVDFQVANHEAFAGATYVWRFGDGAEAETTVPHAAHAYDLGSLARDDLYTVFDTSVTVRRAGEADIEVRKNVAVWSSYAGSKRRGYLQVPAEGPDRLVPFGGLWLGRYTLTNLEDEQIVFTSRRVERQFCDLDRDPELGQSEELTLTLVAREEDEVAVILDDDDLGGDVCGVGIHLSGESESGIPAFANVYYALRDPPALQGLVDSPAYLAVLNQVRDGGLVGGRAVTEEDLYRLSLEGRIELPVRDRAAFDAVGDECDPSEPQEEGFSCVASGLWTETGPYVPNARRGEILLYAECNPVHSMLQALDPPQAFTHEGIITKHYTELANTTISQERLQKKSGSDGWEGAEAEDALRYGWPGWIIQEVNGAFNGELVWNEEDGKGWEVGSFESDPVQCGSDGEIVEPVVLRPVPGTEEARQPALNMVADAAADSALGGHYRWYGYSCGDIATRAELDGPLVGDDDPANPATVSSTYIWSLFEASGVELEGDELEPEDVANGAEVVIPAGRISQCAFVPPDPWLFAILEEPLSVDGLYRYDRAERAAASEVLHNEIYNAIYAEAGWFGEFTTDAADDIGNQFVNCLAFDFCSEDAKDYETWHDCAFDDERLCQPGDGLTVSPDDFLFWDPYGGYTERMIYRPAVYRPLFFLQPAEGTGTLSGVVLDPGGDPASCDPACDPDAGDCDPCALVEILGSARGPVRTGADGRFSIEAVVAGAQVVTATRFIGGVLYEVRSEVDGEEHLGVEVEVVADETTSVELQLAPPRENLRLVAVEVEGRLVDHDDLSPNDVKDFERVAFLSLDPDRETDTTTISVCVDEVRLEIEVRVTLLPAEATVLGLADQSVRVEGEARLYEGTDCDTDDQEDSTTFEFHDVLPGESAGTDIHLENSGIGGGDSADFDVTVRNEEQP